MRNEVPVFFESEISAYTTQFENDLKNPDFISELAVLTDITSHLNVPNKQIQGRNHDICYLVRKIDAFKLKLNKLFIPQLKENNLTFFPSCRKYFLIKKLTFQIMFPHLVIFLLNLKRFQDFQVIQDDLKILSNPFTTEVDKAPAQLQLELCELKEDHFLLSQNLDNPLEFWKLVNAESYPELNNFALRMLPMFSSTYVYESSFSLMNQIKSRERNQPDDETLASCVRVALTDLEIDFVGLVKNKNLKFCTSYCSK